MFCGIKGKKRSSQDEVQVLEGCGETPVCDCPVISVLSQRSIPAWPSHDPSAYWMGQAAAQEAALLERTMVVLRENHS